MPDAWKPGENIKMPDPSDPTKFIEIPADAIEVVAEKPGQSSQKSGPPIQINAEIADSATTINMQPKKGKKKKKKKLLAQT